MGQTPPVSPKIGQKGAEGSVSQKAAGGTTKVSVGEKKTTDLGAMTQVQVRGQTVATPAATSEADTTAETSQTRQAALLQVISQAAEAITTFVSKDVTSTVVTIRQPPIFEGATLTVTEYTTSPQQFNITFANLSPDARRMIESVANQQQLKQALVDRGYTVQNIVIESTPKKAEAIATTEPSGGQGGAEGQETSGEGGEGAGDAEGGVT